MSDERSAFNVRLQSTPSRIPTREGWRPAGNNKVPELRDARIRCDRRAERGSVPLYPARRSRSKWSQVRPLFALFPNMKLGKKVALFRQINMGKPNEHHDALELPDGEAALLPG